MKKIIKKVDASFLNPVSHIHTHIHKQRSNRRQESGREAASPYIHTYTRSEEGELSVKCGLHLGHVCGEDAGGDSAGKVRDGGDAAVLEQEVAELAAVAEDGEALDLLNRVAANLSLIHI